MKRFVTACVLLLSSTTLAISYFYLPTLIAVTQPDMDAIYLIRKLQRGLYAPLFWLSVISAVCSIFVFLHCIVTYRSNKAEQGAAANP